MPRYSLRDGKIAMDKISITGKLMVSDRFENVLASTEVLVASVVQATGTALTLSTAPDCPRAIKICNAAQAQLASTRRFKVVGYNAKGDYVTEIVTAPVGTAGVITSNNAFAYIGSIAPLDNRVVTNFGTFAITFSDKLGLSHPLKAKQDIRSATRYTQPGSGAGEFLWTTSPNKGSELVGSATNKYVNLTYDTIQTASVGINVTGSTLIVRYLSEFQ